MIKVKTFTTELKIFHTAHEIQALDQAVNEFIASGKVGRVVSVSDTATSDSTGATIGLVRVLAYEEAK
ncbi:MAG: hypothetical protein Q7R39_13065 [Dehalococcoidia bacterium]|nr:hypothetical protein [Dehalococcoidia bacterium]